MKGDLILIDPRYYLIGDRPLTMAASEHVNFLKNQIVFRVTRRGDGQPWIEKPITLQDGATTVSPFVVLVCVATGSHPRRWVARSEVLRKA